MGTKAHLSNYYISKYYTWLLKNRNYSWQSVFFKRMIKHGWYQCILIFVQSWSDPGAIKLIRSICLSESHFYTNYSVQKLRLRSKELILLLCPRLLVLTWTHACKWGLGLKVVSHFKYPNLFLNLKTIK